MLNCRQRASKTAFGTEFERHHEHFAWANEFFWGMICTYRVLVVFSEKMQEVLLDLDTAGPHVIVLLA
jgi:hypothetical protein